MNYAQYYYGERCGHLPLNARTIRVLVSESTPEIKAQMAYLSSLFGKDVVPKKLVLAHTVVPEGPQVFSCVCTSALNVGVLQAWTTD